MAGVGDAQVVSGPAGPCNDGSGVVAVVDASGVGGGIPTYAKRTDVVAASPGGANWGGALMTSGSFTPMASGSMGNFP